MSSEIKFLSPDWWQHREISIPWCQDFCAPFFAEDPTLLSNKATHDSVGIIFSNQRDGEIVPVGFTVLQNGNFVFQYHPDYLAGPYPPIAETLPKQKARFVSHNSMLPFFDNLPAEGWFGKAQGAALGDASCLRDIHREQSTQTDGESLETRYHRFMMFGRDYPGAVWTTYARIDPELAEQSYQSTIEAALRSRSSISGMQPKLLGVERNGKLRPANYWETSTYIVKLPATSLGMPGLMEYEYMSILATKKLLPADRCVEASLSDLHLNDGTTQEVLAIKRFDRSEEGHKYPFEEMNQLLGRHNSERYQGAYADIAKLVNEKIGHEGVKQFYARLLCQFLLGNSDNHMKNFAMFHNLNTDRWQLTPDYDLAPTVNYQKSNLALYATSFRHKDRDSIEEYVNLSPKILVRMGQDFGLNLSEIQAISHGILSRIDEAKAAVHDDPSPRLDRLAGKAARQSGHSSESMRDDFCARIDGRKQQLFGTLDKYIALQNTKTDRGWGRAG